MGATPKPLPAALMEVVKGDKFVKLDDWQISIDPKFPNRVLWLHHHLDYQYACIGEPLACRMCLKEIPPPILTLGLLQRIGLERGE